MDYTDRIGGMRTYVGAHERKGSNTQFEEEDGVTVLDKELPITCSKTLQLELESGSSKDVGKGRKKSVSWKKNPAMEKNLVNPNASFYEYIYKDP